MRRYVEYLLIIGITFYTGMLYQSNAFILLGYGEILAGVCSICYLLYMAGKVSVRLSPASDVGEMGKVLPVDLLISNRRILPVGKLKIRIQDEYPVLGKKKTTVFHVTVPGGGSKPGETTIRLAYTARYSGRLTLRIKKAWIYDFLGILPLPIFKKRLSGENTLSIFPQKVSIPIVVERSTRDYAQEREEQAVRGEKPPNESWQIRQYQPGDKLRDIHWKLTAKTDDIMVNEHVSDIGCPVFVFLDYGDGAGKKLRGRRKNVSMEMESYLEIALSLSFSLIECECAHCLVWYDTGMQDVQRMEISSEEDVYLFFRNLENFGGSPAGLSLEDWYQEKYRGNCGNTRLTLTGSFQCLRNGEPIAQYQGKNKKQLLQEQELFV